MIAITNTARCRVNQTRKPSGYYLEKDTGEPCSLNPHTLKLMLKGWDIKQKMTDLKAQMADIEGHFKGDTVSNQGTFVMDGVCKIERQVSSTARITDADALVALLDEPGFVAAVGKIPGGNLMNAMQALQAIASDADHPYSRRVKKLLGVGSSIHLTWSKA